MTVAGLATGAVILMALCEAPLFTVLTALSAVLLYADGGDLLALQTIFIEMYRLAGMPVAGGPCRCLPWPDACLRPLRPHGVSPACSRPCLDGCPEGSVWRRWGPAPCLPP